jgi:competence protein ComEC
MALTVGDWGGNLWVVHRPALIGAFCLAGIVVTLDTLIYSVPFERREKNPNLFSKFKNQKTGWIIMALAVVFRLLPLHQKIPIRVEQLDVGQGDAALVLDTRKENHFSLGIIDAGHLQAISDEGWIELLARRNITHFNWAAISHLDGDHSGGFLRLARLVPIDCLATPQEQRVSSRGKKFQTILNHFQIELSQWQSGCIPYPTFVTPAPRAKKRSRKKSSITPNSHMGAIFVPIDKQGFYLTAGDANQGDEIAISRWAEQFPEFSSDNTQEQIRILKISHHGSKTSSAPEFLMKVKPTEVWISSGQGNSYGHPSVQVLESLKKLGTKIRRTDLEGSLSRNFCSP